MKKRSPVTPQTVREAFGHFPSGIAAISAIHDGKPHVIVTSSFSVGVSLEPPLVAFFVQKTSSTWTTLSKACRLGASILSVEHAAICRQLASHDKESRFQNVRTEITEQGTLHIVGASVWFDCSIHATHPAGDHIAVQLLIHDLWIEEKKVPLVFHKSQFTELAARVACT